jgi:hypothetical protein
MKTKVGMLFFMFLTGIILAATQPTLLYAGAETGGGTSLWDPFVHVSLFTLTPTTFHKGTNLAGPLSILYDADVPQIPECTSGTATMFYTVRLIGGKGSHRQIYWFDGATKGVCLGDIGSPGLGGQGDAILQFLKNAVLAIFPNAKDAQITSVDNAGIAPDSLAFVGDITILVKQ